MAKTFLPFLNIMKDTKFLRQSPMVMCLTVPLVR